MHSGVRVTAKDAIGAVLAGVRKRAPGHFRRHSQPARVQAIDKPGTGLSLEIELLQTEVQRSSDRTKLETADLEAIKLVAVDGHMRKPSVAPCILLVNFHAHKMRHHVRETMVVVAFHPHDFNIPLGIGELADVAEKLPVLFLEAAKIEVVKNVSEKNEAAKEIVFEDGGCFASATDLGAEMQVRQYQRVVDRRVHE